MDIIVTTPKSEMANSAREAADCLAAGGGEYFRRFGMNATDPNCFPGNRVYYVEDGYVRGFAVVDRIRNYSILVRCATTGRDWPAGFYVIMRADSWHWIAPIPMRGFQGFRYARGWRNGDDHQYLSVPDLQFPMPLMRRPVQIVGHWRDPRPEVPA